MQSVRSAYDGYPASGTDGFVDRFFKGLFLAFVFEATCTTTSTRGTGAVALGHTGQVQAHAVVHVLFLGQDRAQGPRGDMSLFRRRNQPTHTMASRRGKLSRSLEVEAVSEPE